MDWLQFFGLIFTLGGLFLWNRSESRADYRELKASTDAQIASARSDMKQLEAGVMAMLMGIREEIKDFHGRLCALEERNKK